MHPAVTKQIKEFNRKPSEPGLLLFFYIIDCNTSFS